ncbi:MAG: hypothetical protein LBD22_03335, partial [Spirochaetaceae bacterium]|nr:hypothetical protein [Spirochaetaceae bacterium]
MSYSIPLHGRVAPAVAAGPFLGERGAWKFARTKLVGRRLCGRTLGVAGALAAKGFARANFH